LNSYGGRVTTTPTTTPLLAPTYRWATIGMVSLIFLFAFEAMAVTTIMPTVSADLEGRAWYSATFSVTLAASIVGMVAAGIWADRRGPRAPMFASAVVFGLGLLVAGLAPGIAVFVAARFLQGLGGGAMTVAIYVLVARIYDPVDHPRIFGAFAAAWVIPAMVGPTLAGAVAETVGWRWVFLGVVGLAGAATAILRPALRQVADRPEPSPVASGRRLVLAGVVAAGVVSVDLAGRAGGAAAYPLAAGALLVLLLAARPLLPPRTLRAGRGLPSVVGLRGIISAAFFATEIYVPYLLQEHYGLAVWLSGLALTVGALGWAGASQVQARLGARLENAVALRTGALLLLTGIGLVLATAALEVTPWLVGLAWVLAGSGMGLTYPRIGILVLESSTEDQQGANTAAMWIADSAGGATAVSLTGLVFAAVGTATDLAPFVAVFVTTAALAVVAVLVSRRTTAVGGSAVG
jgi:MFS family permease